MKKTIITLGIFLICMISCVMPIKANNNTSKPGTIFTAVEKMPEFPGGNKALMKFISDNLVYPPSAKESRIEGRVIVQLVVTETGEIGDVRIVRGVDMALDNEAIRVVKSLPRFTPAFNDGQAVNAWYTIPVTFKLDE